MEKFGLEWTFKGHQFQPCCHEQTSGYIAQLTGSNQSFKFH